MMQQAHVVTAKGNSHAEAITNARVQLPANATILATHCSELWFKIIHTHRAKIFYYISE